MAHLQPAGWSPAWSFGIVLCLCMLVKDLGIRVIRNVPKIIKGSTHENQLLGIILQQGGFLKFEVKISIDQHGHGEVNAHGEDGV